MSMADRDGHIWYDGRLVPWRNATTHVLTHSLHYGLAVFEGLRAYSTVRGTAIFRLKEHTERLFNSAHIYMMKIPYSREALMAAHKEVVRANKLESCYIRPIAFYGSEKMGVSPKGVSTHVAIAAWPWGAYLGEDSVKRGARLKTSSFCRFHHNSLMSQGKITGHYVNSVLAGYEARRNGYDEALMLDVDGFVAEGCGENLFVIRDGVVKAPPLTSSLPGITRDSVIRILADMGIFVIEQRFPRDAVYIADEAFMTGTAVEVTPVRELDDRSIGSATPGPITTRVQETFRAAVEGRDPRYRNWLHYI